MNSAMRLTSLFVLFLCFSACEGASNTKDNKGPDDPGGDIVDPGGDIVSPSDPNSPLPPVQPNPENHAPELRPIGNKRVSIGKSLIIQLVATDTDGDTLRYSVSGNIPADATFDKTLGLFTWSPQAVVRAFTLTFAVSDGLATARETVQIEVLDATAAPEPPVFEPIGDQELQVGASFSLQLRANDPAGDRIDYDHEGRLPEGAQLNKDTGLFTWRPSSEFSDAVVKIVFIASNATQSAKMPVTFRIKPKDTPSQLVSLDFPSLSPAEVAVGSSVSVTLQAVSSDGAQVSYEIMGANSYGGQATVEGNKLTFTPSASYAGSTWSVMVAAKTADLMKIQTWRVTILEESHASCVDDSNEPNNSRANATPILAESGSTDANICQTAENLDYDVYAKTLEAGDRINVRLSHGNGPVSLVAGIFSATDELLSGTDVASAGTVLSYSATAKETVYIWVFSDPYFPVPEAQHGVNYSLEMAVISGGNGGVCEEDSYAGNHQLSSARALGSAESLGDDLWDVRNLMICEGSKDFWSFQGGCAAKYEVIVTDHYQEKVDASAPKNGRLSLGWYESQTQTSPRGVHQEETGNDLILTFGPLENPGPVYLGVSPKTGSSDLQIPYELMILGSYNPVCFPGAIDPDYEISGNHSPNDAVDLYFLEGDLPVIKACCESDYYSFEAYEGAAVRVWADITSGRADLPASLSMTIYDSSGTQQASIGKDINTSYMYFVPEKDGEYLLEVKGRPFTDYELHWMIEEQLTPCTKTSCGPETVCDEASGHCVSEVCWRDSDCPGDYVCPSLACTYACQNNSDCRDDQVCESYAGGKWCVVPWD